MADSLLRIGARIQATSNDERYPPRSVIDGRADTFWATGGTYPQQFTITFPSMVTIKNVTIYCYKVRDLMLEKSTKQIPIKFEAVAEKELERRENDLNVELIVSTEFKAQHLRFTIRAAYDHFCSVHKVTLGDVTPAERGALLDEPSSSGNLLSAGGNGDVTQKLSPRHPRSAMRRRRESLAQNGSPVKIHPDVDSDDEEEGDFRKPLPAVTNITRHKADDDLNLAGQHGVKLVKTDEVVPIKDDDDDDLGLG